MSGKGRKMIRSVAAVCIAGAALAGCQSADPRYYYTDRDCLDRQNTSRVLAAATGIGLGLLVPGGGLAGIGVGLATDPRCQAYHLTPEGRVRLREDMRRARERDLVPVDLPERSYRPAPPPSGRPLDNIPSSTPVPVGPN
jgi:hypothetical protein